MSTSVIYGIDGASFQGNIAWSAVDAVCAFGAEKVTEGNNYVNPFWSAAKPAMLARAKATGFVPIAYMFLDANSSGADQADHFATFAGSMDGFAIVVDVERSSTGSPTRLQTKRAVSRLRKHYPDHKIGGYAPRWFAGGWQLKFFSWIWASSYVTGSGLPHELYARVPASYWDGYGGQQPMLLQFTSLGSVPGVNGDVDVSAFRGTQHELREKLLGVPAAQVKKEPAPAPKPAPAPVPKPATVYGSGDSMYVKLSPGVLPTTLPVWLPLPKGVPAPYSRFAMHLVGGTGAIVRVQYHYADGTTDVGVFPTGPGKVAEVMPPKQWGKVATVDLSRSDSAVKVGATAVITTW